MLSSRQIAKSILQGVVPERPLIVPIVFALGAKIENLSFRAYLDNPTKISNALRQIRTHLRTDGVSCYFDPDLELEALGFQSQWDAANQTRTISFLDEVSRGDLPPNLRSPEEAASSSRVNIAVEVIRRLNSLLRDEPLLMAGVSGPYTLAARLTQLEATEMQAGALPFELALGTAAAAITKIASALVEAGANLIFIREEILPPLSVENSADWASLLAPVFNIIRFYEAQPVLQLAREAATANNLETILQQPMDATLCVPSEKVSNRTSIPAAGTSLGWAIPLASLVAGEFPANIQSQHGGYAPVLLTTDGDVPVTTDLKRLVVAFNSITSRK